MIPRKLWTFRASKLRLLHALLGLGMISISGCGIYPEKPPASVNWLVADSLPPFPVPDSKVADELIEVCPNHKCVALYEWLGRLKVLQEQLELYKDKSHE